MDKKISVLAVTGDRRQQRAIELLKESFDIEEVTWPSYNKGKKTDVLLLPMLSSDGDFDKLFDRLRDGALILGGRLSDKFIKDAEGRGFKCFDYYKGDVIQIKNALPTAEGTLMAAMQQGERCIAGSRVLVTGYGHCGKQIARVFGALSANVIVAARSAAAHAEAESCGFRAIPIDEIRNVIPAADTVINTVPANIIGEHEIKAAGDETVFLEVASAPCGIDEEMCKKYKKILIRLPAIPARYAPITSGEYIAQAVDEILKDKFKLKKEEEM